MHIACEGVAVPIGRERSHDAAGENNLVIRLTAVIELEGHAPRALTHESNARSIVLGRDSSADFQLPLSTISRRHVRISESDGVYFVEDLGSTHGTLLNGVKLDSGEKKILRNGDLIELTKAKVTCSIDSEKVALADPGEGTQAIAVRAVQGILGRLGDAQNDGPFFRALNGPDEGARYSLSGPAAEWALGRSRDCDFVLNDPNISRRHALVRKDWNGFFINDLGSKNGVVVNSRQVPGSVRLNDRDEVVIGPLKLIFIDPDAELLAALKDVPGFDLDDGSGRDPAGFSAESVSPGVSEEQRGEELGPPLGIDGEASLDPVDDFPGGEHAEDRREQRSDVQDIDPDLLETIPGRSPVELLMIGGVGVVIVVSIILLFAILV